METFQTVMGPKATAGKFIHRVSLVFIVLLFFPLGAREVEAQKFCSKTATAAFKACGFEASDDYWIAAGKCNNEADPKSCIQTAKDDRKSKKEECKEQLEARRAVCALLGEAPYNPGFDPANFIDPDTINIANANPYFPLIVNRQWIYEGGGETITVTVTNKTKLIQGVACRVVNDVVEENGNVKEDTNDWFAQDLAGNVWYCGEEAKDFETFAGDNPAEPELVSIDGSFKVGRDGAKPGIIMLAAPQVGAAYREEVALGEAEDVAEVIDVVGNEQVAANIPAAQCNNDCLVTRNFTPLEPGVDTFKHYKPGVGLILEVDGDGNRVELTQFNPGP